MKQGLRASILPAINLAQISEFSLVVIQTGIAAGHIKTETSSAASFAFVVLAVISTFGMGRSNRNRQRPDRALEEAWLARISITASMPKAMRKGMAPTASLSSASSVRRAHL